MGQLARISSDDATSICWLKREPKCRSMASCDSSDIAHRRRGRRVTGNYRIQDRGENADIGFPACHDQRICSEPIECLAKGRLGKWGIVTPVDDISRRGECCQRRHQFDEPGVKLGTRHLAPAIITPPGSNRLLRSLGRHEAGENRTCAARLGRSGHGRQYPLEPGDVPVGPFSEEGLHIDAEMHGAGTQEAKAKSGSHAMSLPSIGVEVDRHAPKDRAVVHRIHCYHASVIGCAFQLLTIRLHSPNQGNVMMGDAGQIKDIVVGPAALRPCMIRNWLSKKPCVSADVTLRRRLTRAFVVRSEVVSKPDRPSAA